MTALPGLAPIDTLDLEGTAWGIDPSTWRMSLAECGPARRLRWDTQVLPTVRSRSFSLALRQAQAHDTCAAWLGEKLQRWGYPTVIAIEQPFGGGGMDRFIKPESYYAIGALLCAIGHVAPDTAVVFFGPGQWKKLAMGEGRGAAKKPEIKRWAEELTGKELLQDEADALGLAVAAATRISR